MLQADVAAAMAIGMQAALVRSGKYREGDASRVPEAWVEDDLSRVVARLL